jgi:sugar phosphate permease
MKNLIAKYNLWYRFQQLIILVLHLILLKWMYYVLSNSGSFTMLEVCYHFIGMSIMGAVLIRGCAAWAKHHYKKELQQKRASADENEIQDIRQ